MKKRSWTATLRHFVSAILVRLGAWIFVRETEEEAELRKAAYVARYILAQSGEFPKTIKSMRNYGFRDWIIFEAILHLGIHRNLPEKDFIEIFNLDEGHIKQRLQVAA